MGIFSTLAFRKRSQPEPAVEQAEPAATVETTPPAAAEVAAPTLVEEVAAPAVPPEVEAAAPAEVASLVAEAQPVVNSQARAQAEDLVRQVTQELPNFLTVAVVEAASGLILAGQWAGHSGGAVEVAVANAEIVRQARQAIAALQLEPTEQLEDILITLRRQLYLLRVLPQQQWLLYLAMRTQDTNLALAKAVLQSFAS